MRIAIFGMTFPETSKNYLQHLIKKIENENSQIIVLKICFQFIFRKMGPEGPSEFLVESLLRAAVIFVTA